MEGGREGGRRRVSEGTRKEAKETAIENGEKFGRKKLEGLLCEQWR